MRGAGVWLRRHGDLDPIAAAEALDVVVIAGQTARGPVNRGPTWRRWIADYLRARPGVQVWIMDWLSPATRAPGHMPDLAAWARDQGAAGLMGDCEPDAGYRSAPLADVRRYADALHGSAEDHGLDVAITDYGTGGVGQPRLRILLGADRPRPAIGVPQSYDPIDPDGSDPRHTHARSVDYWRAAGATRIVVGLSLWLRSRRAHRTAAEFAGHLEGVPDDVPGVLLWYGATRDATERLSEVLPMLRTWSETRRPAGVRSTLPPPASTVREELLGELERLVRLAREAGDVTAADELGGVMGRLGRCV